MIKLSTWHAVGVLIGVALASLLVGKAPTWQALLFVAAFCLLADVVAATLRRLMPWRGK